MKTKKLFIFLITISLFSFPLQARTYRFSGGPSGGVFQVFATGISQYIKENNKINILASASGGSIENIRLVNSGKADFGVAYSGDIFNAREGKLANDTSKYTNVLALAFLYGAPAQLVVRENSKITSARQLENKKVAVGNPGSGAFASAEIFFRAIGIWEKIKRENLGYREAADAFKNNQIDAFWVFAGAPNSAILEVALQTKIKLIDLYNDGESAGLFKKYPFYDKVLIPANTYSGQTKEVITYQDGTILIANPSVPEDVVYNLLKSLYSKEGIDYLIKVHQSAKEMSVKDGIRGIVTPLHPGAEKFWKEMGVLKK